MTNEQEVNDKLIITVLDYISKANDLLERQLVLDIAVSDIKSYVIKMEGFGLFDSWWTEKALQKEAKAFLKNPKESAFSTLKQELFGSVKGELYTIFFHLKCPAIFYYKSIRKNKMSYLVNNSNLVYMKVERFDKESKKDIIVFEQSQY